MDTWVYTERVSEELISLRPSDWMREDGKAVGEGGGVGSVVGGAEDVTI